MANPILLEEFFTWEYRPLRRKIQAALDADDPPPVIVIGGNVYVLTIDFENGVVVIINDLDTSEAGEQRFPIDEFKKALKERQGRQTSS